MNIGMIGIGLMGHGIASNIMKDKKYSLTFLDHKGNQPTDRLIQAGAKKADTIAKTVQGAEVVILCVTGVQQVEEVIFGDGGIAQNAARNTVILDCSTSLPDKTKAFAQTLLKSEIELVDAAMTRTPKEAAEGRLNLIVGSSKAQFEKLHPLMSQFAEVITHAGDVGSGQALKLIHNYVSLGYAAIMAQAAAQAEQAGISPEIFLNVLHAGGGNSVVLERFRPYVTNKDISGLQFSMSNAAKDIGYFIQANGDNAIGSALVDLFCKGIENNGHDKSVLTLIDMLVAEKN